MEASPKIRDKRRQMFLTDDDYLNGYSKLCGIYATAVYMSLCRHANKQQYSFPSIETMAEQHNCGKDSIIKGIKSLEEYNIILVDREKEGKKATQNNGYTLLDRSEWKLKASLLDRPNQVHEIDLSKSTRKTVRDLYNRSTHAKGPHIKDLSKDKSSKESLLESGENVKTEEKTFSWPEYLETMRNDSKPHIRIIARYFKKKKISFSSQPQIQSALKRHLRSSKELVPFSDDDLEWAANYCKNKWGPKNLDWTLETMLKALTSGNRESDGIEKSKQRITVAV